MTLEEDAFVAALVLDPVDEATRLVYADWLEEHGDDVRAAFLRAELTHFRKAWDERPENQWGVDDRHGGKWWETSGLDVDPVWAATVCRAPIGILVPGLTFGDTGPKITRAELKFLEDHWGQPLPADYAAFMLLFNGGKPSKPYLCSDRTIYHEEGEETRAVHCAELRLFSLGERDESGRRYDRTSALELSGGYVSSRMDFDMDRMIPVGMLTADGRSSLLTLLLEPAGEANPFMEFEIGDGSLGFVDDTNYGTLALLLGSLVERRRRRR